MAVSYRNLLLKLGAFSVKPFLSNPNVKLTNVQFHEDGCRYPFLNTLIICESISDARSAAAHNAGNILCVTDEEMAAIPGVNLIHVCGGGKQKALYNTVYEMFLSRGILSEEYAMLMKILAADSSVERMLAESRRLMHNPILVVNTKMEIIAQNYYDEGSKPEELTQFAELVNGDNVFRKEIAATRQPRLILLPAKIEKALGQRAVCSRLLVNGTVYGYAFVLEYLTPLISDDLEKMELVCSAISCAFKMEGGTNRANTAEVRRLMRMLLTNTGITDYMALESRFKLLGCRFDGQMLVGVFETKNEEDARFHLVYTERELAEMMKDAELTVTNEKIVMLISLENFTAQRTKLCAYLEEKSLHAAFSRPFQGLENTRAHYQQAQEALSVGIYLGAKAVMFFYDDFNPFYSIRAYSKHHPVESMIHPAVLSIADLDRQRGSDLVKTLFAYFESMGDSNLAAKRLHIHRNTLYKRLDKILEITGWNPVEPSGDYGSVYYSIKLYEYTNRVFLRDEIDL